MATAKKCEDCKWRHKWNSTKGGKRSNGFGSAPIECWNCKWWASGMRRLGFMIADYFEPTGADRGGMK